MRNILIIFCSLFPLSGLLANPQNPVKKPNIVWIEAEDFEEMPPKGFFRMTPGAEVRLRNAYIVRCTELVRDENNTLKEIHCTYDPDSRGGTAPDGRKIKGTIHWVSADHALDAEVRLFDRLFNVPNPDKGGIDYKEYLNPLSVEALPAKLEASLVDADVETRYQFERLGYFCQDTKDSSPHKKVFNRIVTLRDAWSTKK